MNTSRLRWFGLAQVFLAILLTATLPSTASAAAGLELPIYLPLVNGGYDPADTVLVPAGEFQMGCDPAHNGGFACASDAPLHTVYLAAYTIDRYEVTNGQYVKCELSGACPPPQSNASKTRPSYYNNPLYKDYPVINVSWQAAASYCAWAGKHLPTEAQWEKAVRGVAGSRAFPWGDQPPDCTRVNGYNDAEFRYCVGDTSQAGSYPPGASSTGALDLAGNVWEWLNDWYQPDYYSLSPYANPPGPASGDSKVLRGGSFANGTLGLLSASRFAGDPLAYDVSLGFRCAGGP